jgi:hypothetical protein
MILLRGSQQQEVVDTDKLFLLVLEDGWILILTTAYGEHFCHRYRISQSPFEIAARCGMKIIYRNLKQTLAEFASGIDMGFCFPLYFTDGNN